MNASSIIKTSRRNIITLLLLGNGLFLSCQKISIKTVKIFESSKGIGPCEPSVFINPANKKNIVVGSVLDNFHYSFDGGETWETRKLKSHLGVWGDPCIVADNVGNFYYFHLSDPEGTNWKSKKILDRIVVQKSTDGGRTWSDGKGIGADRAKQQDKEWAVVNPENGNIYVTWTEFDKYGSKDKNHKSRILYSMSEDEGDSWSTPIAINEVEGNAIDDDETVEGAVPSVSRDGSVYVAWSYKDSIYFDKSEKGKGWLKKDIVISQQPGGWSQDIPGIPRVNGMPVTAVDNSGSQYAGTIYVNWTDQRNGVNDTDVFLSKSVDQGNTWTSPKRINDDQTKTHQFLTWMAVDSKTGYIYIVYYDRSKYKDNQTDVKLSISKDGGESFKVYVISKKPFIHDSTKFFGDYNNISAFDGTIRAVWTHSENNKLSIWAGLIEDH